MRSRIRIPSPAMIVALIALCVALGGTGYAATKINGKNIRNGSIPGKKLKNRTITSSKISSATVRAFKNRRGLRGPRGFRGPRGRRGAKGDAGASGAALAYARVASDGTLDTARSKGITQANVSHPSAGVYCLKLSFSPNNVVATPEAGATNDEVLYAAIPPPAPPIGCAADAVAIQIRHAGGVNTNLGFYVAFN